MDLKDIYHAVSYFLIFNISGPIPFLSTRDISIELAKNGFASIYTGSGAEYDGNLESLQRAVMDAQRNKRGIWSNGIERMMNPSDYKRAIKAGLAF